MNWRQAIRGNFYSLLLHPALIPVWDRLHLGRKLGSRGELIAERMLLSKGYIILARNHRTRFGEVDLVAADDRTVVFVEVKTRTTHQAGLPAEAVDEEKQRRLSKAAYDFVRRHHLSELKCRFDVVAIDFVDDPSVPRVLHYQNAFEFAFDSE